ncbi:MAG: hypothetical protein KAS90_03170 [Candidatus Aenigmarchaeota archaeon]|nr:hypothetical protein [Candidatus Aenigmarchaeota archaeon]
MSSQICEPASSAEQETTVKQPENNMKNYVVLGGNGRIYNTYDIVCTSSLSNAANRYNAYTKGPNSFVFIGIDLDKINLDNFDIDRFLGILPEDTKRDKEYYLSKILMENKLYCHFVLDDYLLDRPGQTGQYEAEQGICKSLEKSDLNFQFMSLQKLDSSFIEMFLDALDLENPFFIKGYPTGNN